MQQGFEDTLQTSQEAIGRLEQRVEEITTDRDRTLTLLEKYDKCRHCEKDFGSYVDKHEGSVMRCKMCRGRHYIRFGCVVYEFTKRVAGLPDDTVNMHEWTTEVKEVMVQGLAYSALQKCACATTLKAR
jgi:hypothetical protein